MPRVYLSLGSNVEPERHLHDALEALRGRFGNVVVSRVYRSAAVGFEGAPFLNCAAAFDVDVTHDTLRTRLRELEDASGRDRNLPRYADRTLDLDIALWCEGEVCHSDLVCEEFDRAHVLAPLADIAPDINQPFDGETLAARWKRLSGRLLALERLPWDWR